MFFLLTIMLILITGMMFSQMKHPLSMGLTLIIQTILIALNSGMINKSFWYSYILFLVFIGGMLVLFIYTTAISSNEMFKLSTKMIMTTILLTTIIIMMLLMNFPHNLIQLKNSETQEFLNTFMLTKENSDMLIKLYNKPTYHMTILLINYLLITFLIIVKITKKMNGPLRPMN